MFFRFTADGACDAREPTILPTRIPSNEKSHPASLPSWTNSISSTASTTIPAAISSISSQSAPNIQLSNNKDTLHTQAMLVFNIRGMDPSINSRCHYKVPYLRTYLELENTDYLAIAITETWLRSYIEDSQISLPNYQQPFRSERSQRGRGGALLYIKKELPITKVDCFNDEVCQAVICLSPPTKLVIGCVYKPPDASQQSFTAVLKFLQTFISSLDSPDHHKIVILGDFNFPNISWTDLSIKRTTPALAESGSDLMEFMSENFMTQFVDIPSREKNTLDLVISNSPELIYEISTEDTKLSDHKLVKVMLPSGVFRGSMFTDSPNYKDFKLLDFHKADFDKIRSSLAAVDWKSLGEKSGLQDFSSVLKDVVLSKCREFCPPRKSSGKHHPPIQNLHALQRKKRKLRGHLEALKKLNPTSGLIPPLETKLKIIHSNITLLIKENSLKQERIAVSKMKSDPKFFYSYAKKFRKMKHSISQLFKEDGKTITTNSTEMANLLQNQFVQSFSDPNDTSKESPCFSVQDLSSTLEDFSVTPSDIHDAIDEISANSSCSDSTIPAPILKECKFELTEPLLLMWNESLNTGIIPEVYKHQVITPVHKKGSKALSSNYRPISLTPHEIKILERILRKKIVDHLQANNLLSCKQHGFQKGKSCLTQLLSHYDLILKNLMDGNETDSIYLDFAKAFDKVDHSLLLQKLQLYGIRGKVYKWIKDFLSNRTQEVVINGSSSFITAVISGVPQGSVLGPILFLIFMNDIESFICSSDVGCFADDTRLSKCISLAEDCALLQEDLNKVMDWTVQNNMALHKEKFVYMNFHSATSRPLVELPFQSQFREYSTSPSNTLLPCEQTRDLGINISSNMSWNPHIMQLVKKANMKSGWCLSVFHDRSPPVMKTLYKSTVRSHLEYSCPLWSGLSISDAMALEAVQRKFTSRIYFNSTHQPNYWERLKILNLMSLQRRRERYIILHMWKLLNNKTSNDLGVSFHFNDRLGFRAKVPKLYGTNHKARSLYHSSFATKGPLLWNILPKELNCSTTFSTFKINLDKMLKSVPDLPPVPGYSTSNHNSLLDWSSCRSFLP